MSELHISPVLCIKCHIGSESIETDKSQRKQDSFTFTHCMDNENIIIIIKKNTLTMAIDEMKKQYIHACIHIHDDRDCDGGRIKRD